MAVLSCNTTFKLKGFYICREQEIEQLNIFNNVQDILGFHYDSNQVKIPSKTLEWQAVK